MNLELDVANVNSKDIVLNTVWGGGSPRGNKKNDIDW